jgi:predicted membrane-bound mannosyltransferase
VDASATSSGGTYPLLPVGLVVALAVGVRAASGFADVVVFNDGPEFVRIAELLGRGEVREALAHPFHPLTSAAMAVLHAVTGVSLETAARAVSVLSGGVAAAAVYGIANAALGPRVALVATLLFAVNPRMVASSSSVQSDGLHLPLFLVAVLLGWRALDTKRTAPAVGAGLLCALAYLTRPEGALIAAVFGVWLFVEVVARRTSLFGAVRLGMAFASPFLMAAGLYLIALSQEAGKVTVTEKKLKATRQLGADALDAAHVSSGALWTGITTSTLHSDLGEV